RLADVPVAGGARGRGGRDLGAAGGDEADGRRGAEGQGGEEGAMRSHDASLVRRATLFRLAGVGATGPGVAIGQPGGAVRRGKRRGWHLTAARGGGAPPRRGVRPMMIVRPGTEGEEHGAEGTDRGAAGTEPGRRISALRAGDGTR